MKLLLSTLPLLLWAMRLCAADVLIVADEFPAMQVLASHLQTESKLTSQLIDQSKLPPALDTFRTVVVYIHRGLDDAAEHAFIKYAQDGGRLVLLHHSISSGKRQNHDWFRFLGVQLPQGQLAQGGYQWIEGVTAQWVDLAPHPIMTNRVNYPEQVAFTRDAGSESGLFPGFTLAETEVYLNHVLTGPRTILMGLKYHDAAGHSWNQATAGWLRPAGKGWVIYFMPGHTAHDFENPPYRQLVLNAISLPFDS